MANSNRVQSNKLVSEVKAIADLYFYSLEVIKKRQQLLRDSEQDVDEYISYVVRVRAAFHTLKHVEQIFINNEFFYEAYPDWWRDLYKESAYYRIRKNSMKHFKEAVENAY